MQRWILQFGLCGPKTGQVHKSCRAHQLDVGCGMEVAMEFFILFFCPNVFLLGAYFACTTHLISGLIWFLSQNTNDWPNWFTVVEHVPQWHLHSSLILCRHSKPHYRMLVFCLYILIFIFFDNIASFAWDRALCEIWRVLRLFLFPLQSRRKRPRTPTPGNYLGVKNIREPSELFFFLSF